MGDGGDDPDAGARKDNREEEEEKKRDEGVRGAEEGADEKNGGDDDGDDDGSKKEKEKERGSSGGRGGKEKERSNRGSRRGRSRSKSRSRSRSKDNRRKDRDRKRSRSRSGRDKDKKRRRSRSRSRSRDRKKKRSRSRSRSRDRKKRRSRSKSREKKSRKDKDKDKHHKKGGGGGGGGSPAKTAATLLGPAQMATLGAAASQHRDMGMGRVLPSGLLGPQGVGSAAHMDAITAAMGLTLVPDPPANSAAATAAAAAAVGAGAIVAGVGVGGDPRVGGAASNYGGLGYGLAGTSGGAAAAKDREALGDGGAGGLMMVEANLERSRVQWRDATRNSRRLYVGHVNSLETTQESLQAFINAKVAATGCTPWHSAATGTNAIESCHVSDKGFAFLECTALEDVNAVLAFDGVFLNGRNIKIRRPKDYAREEDPLELEGAMEENVRRTYEAIVKPRVEDSPTKMFLGNIHPEVTVKEARELITSFGNLKAIHADVDGRGKIRVGIWFDYEDPDTATHAVPGLTGLWIKGQRLVAALATPDAEAPRAKPGGGGAGAGDGVNKDGGAVAAEGEGVAADAGGGNREGEGTPEPDPAEPRKKAPCTYRVPPDAEPLMYPPQRVLEFSGILSADMDEEDREAAAEDCRLECLSLGNVLSTHVEGPAVALLGDGTSDAAADDKSEGDDDVDDVDEAEDEDGNPKKPRDMTKYWGKLYVEFARIETATIAAHSFHRRSFDGRTVTVKYFPLSSYQRAFGKGIPPRTHEEKQMAAIKAQEYLSSAIPETSYNPKLPGTV